MTFEEGPGLRKRTVPDALAKRRSQDSLYLAIILGMVVLLVTVIALVAELGQDDSSDPAFINLWLKSHQSRLYFLEAKSLVKPLIKTSVEKWSRPGFDENTGCMEVSNGVWYAAGTVDTKSNDGVTAHQPWKIYFMAETATPLLTKVGDLEIRNLPETPTMTQPSSETAPEGR
jgi:hypothetical protein